MDVEREQNRDLTFHQLEALAAQESLDESSSNQLIRLLSHPYQWFRIRAAEILGRSTHECAAQALAMALNDRCEYVAAAAAESLRQIGSSQALEYVRIAFLDDQVQRPHYLANALAGMGTGGYEVLMRAAASESPTLRYYAAKGLGSSGREEAITRLEQLSKTDHAETTFRGKVSTAAKDGLKTLARLRAHAGKQVDSADDPDGTRRREDCG
jgi:HEAT repeat protein